MFLCNFTNKKYFFCYVLYFVNISYAKITFTMKMNNKILITLVFTNLCYSQNIGIGNTDPNITIAIKDNSTGLQYHSENKISIVTNAVNRITVDDTNVGINNLSPSKILDIDANNNYLRVSNLAQNSNLSNTLINPIMQNSSNAEVGYLDDINVYIESQTMRMVIREDQNIWGRSSLNKEHPVRLKYNPENTTPNVNGFQNYFNDVSGSSILFNQNAPSGNGVPARTTDQIKLPAGVYRITLRITSSFLAHDNNNSIDIKLAVNNNEYSFANGVNYGEGNTHKTGFFTETVNLNTESVIDFLYVKQTGSDNQTSGSYNSDSNLYINAADNIMRSILMIERLK